MRRLHRVLLLLCYLLVHAGHAAWYHPKADDPFLMIGHGWADVREERIYTLQRGQQQLVIYSLPETLELPTFTLRSGRFDLSVLSWGWAAPANQPDAQLISVGNGVAEVTRGALRWSPSKNDPGETHRIKNSLICNVQSPVKGVYPLEHLYRAEGFDWSARYRAVVHSRLDRVDVRVSLDLEALIRLVNTTAHSYTNAQLLLRSNGNKQENDSNEPGFLLLNYDSPLSDFGQTKNGTAGVPHLYPPEGRFNVPAHSEIDIPLFARERLSAEQIFLFSAEVSSVSEVAKGISLRRVLQASPSGGAQRSSALPAGPLQSRAAGSGLHSMRQAMVRHTPQNEPIMLDLGEDQNATARRYLKEKKPIEPAVDEYIYEWSVQNAHEWPIQVRIEDIPPVPLEWTLTRSTEPAEQDGAMLKFSFSVPARSEYTLRYHIHVETPAL